MDQAGASAPGPAQPQYDLATATCLTTIAGFVDAVGYVPLGHLYLSFMSGNSTHLGIALGAEGWSDAASAAGVIACFVAGVTFGTLVFDGRWGLGGVLVCEVLLLALAAALVWSGPERAGLLLVAVAMGFQNTLHRVVGGADVGRGFLTGNLFALGQSLARFRRSGEPMRAMQNALSWGSFVVGVIAGTLAFAFAGLLPCLVAAAAAVAILAGGALIFQSDVVRHP